MYSSRRVLIRFIGLVGRLWFGLACVALGLYQLLQAMNGLGWSLLLSGLFILPKSTPWNSPPAYDDALLVVGCLIVLGWVLY